MKMGPTFKFPSDVTMTSFYGPTDATPSLPPSLRLHHTPPPPSASATAGAACRKSGTQRRGRRRGRSSPSFPISLFFSHPLRASFLGQICSCGGWNRALVGRIRAPPAVPGWIRCWPPLASVVAGRPLALLRWPPTPWRQRAAQRRLSRPLPAVTTPVVPAASRSPDWGCKWAVARGLASSRATAGRSSCAGMRT